MAMSAGGMHESVFTAAWPTGEFGGMGLEGYVLEAFAKEMEAIADPAERALVRGQGGEPVRAGQALSIASALEIDAVIDPAETRRWIVAGWTRVPAPFVRQASRFDNGPQASACIDILVR